MYAFRLQKLADSLVSRFVSAGLMTQQYDTIKLHITAINTLFRKDPGGVSQPQYREHKVSTRDRESFDARGIFKVKLGLLT